MTGARVKVLGWEAGPCGGVRAGLKSLLNTWKPCGLATESVSTDFHALMPADLASEGVRRSPALSEAKGSTLQDARRAGAYFFRRSMNRRMNSTTTALTATSTTSATSAQAGWVSSQACRADFHCSLSRSVDAA